MIAEKEFVVKVRQAGRLKSLTIPKQIADALEAGWMKLRIEDQRLIYEPINI